jgi:hypothetical protein
LSELQTHETSNNLTAGGAALSVPYQWLNFPVAGSRRAGISRSATSRLAKHLFIQAFVWSCFDGNLRADAAFRRVFLQTPSCCSSRYRSIDCKRLKLFALIDGGIGLAFNTLPKRSVTVFDNRKYDTNRI